MGLKRILNGFFLIIYEKIRQSMTDSPLIDLFSGTGSGHCQRVSVWDDNERIARSYNELYHSNCSLIISTLIVWRNGTYSCAPFKNCHFRISLLPEDRKRGNITTVANSHSLVATLRFCIILTVFDLEVLPLCIIC